MAYIQRGVGERGLVLVNDGFRYHRHRLQRCNIIWRCWRRSTRDARLKTNVFVVEATAPRIRVIEVGPVHMATFCVVWATASPILLTGGGAHEDK